MSLKDDNEDFV